MKSQQGTSSKIHKTLIAHKMCKVLVLYVISTFYTFRLLLRKRAKASVQNAQGQTPVHLAVMTGQSLSTDVINMAYPPYVDCTDNMGKTAMDHAIERGMVECVNALLISKFSHSAVDDGRDSFEYMTCAQNNILHKACFLNDKEVIKKISEAAREMSDSNGSIYSRLKIMLTEKDLNGKNPMEIAATSMEWEVFYYIIVIMHSIRGQVKTKFWLSFDLDPSALLRSAISSSRYRACLLLDYLSWQDLLTDEDLEDYLQYFKQLLNDREGKWTLLEYAIDNCSSEAVAAILPLQDSEFVGNLYETENILYRACNFIQGTNLSAGPFEESRTKYLSHSNNIIKKLEVLLNYANGQDYADGIQGVKLDVNIMVNGQSLLHHSVKQDKEVLTKFLIERGADVNAVDDSGSCTPLHLAAASGNLAILETLLDAGAKTEVWHAEIRDFVSSEKVLNKAFRHEYGNSALPVHAAIVSGNDPQGHCVSRLLEACPDHASTRTNLNGFQHHTPLILAALCTTANGQAQLGVIDCILKYERDYLELHNFIYEETALCAAVRVGNVEAVQRLLEAGANVEHKIRSIPKSFLYSSTNGRELTPLALTLALRLVKDNTL